MMERYSGIPKVEFPVQGFGWDGEAREAVARIEDGRKLAAVDDHAMARQVRTIVAELNLAIRDATKAGLRVTVMVEDIETVDSGPADFVTVDVVRPLLE